jgi:D-alanyl-D-alanine carboxypeptidase
MNWKTIIVIAASFFLITGCNKIDFLSKKAPNENIKSSQKQSEPKNDTSDPLTLNAVFFNEIKEVAGKNVIQNPSNVLALVNKQYFLPDIYAPKDLVRPNVEFSFGNQNIEKSYMRKEAAEALAKMFAEAKKAGIPLLYKAKICLRCGSSTVWPSKSGSRSCHSRIKRTSNGTGYGYFKQVQ